MLDALAALNAAPASRGLDPLHRLADRRSVAGRVRAVEHTLGSSRVLLRLGRDRGGLTSIRLPDGGRLDLGRDVGSWLLFGAA
jgi:hypothetical protein